METKRFIGSDMARLYDRIRNTYGPDAVIMGTRTLAREGAPPLVELIAGPPEAALGPDIALDLQWSMLNGALSRLEGERGPATVGDLEELALREHGPDPVAPSSPARTNLPEWLGGFVENAPRPAQVPGLGPAAPSTDGAAQPVKPIEWPERPRPFFTRRHSAHAETGGSAGDRLALALRERGFTPGAIAAVTGSEAPDTEPSRAVARALTALEVPYPGEEETALITVEGGPASGRTVALVRMALDCADSGRDVVLIAADATRVAAREQVYAYATALGITVEEAFDAAAMTRVAAAAPRGACLFADVAAGDLAPSAGGARHLRFASIPAHWQQQSVHEALARLPLSEFAGGIITFADLTGNLAPAVSTLLELRLGLAFICSGRDVSTGVGEADAITIASGIFTPMTGETTYGPVEATA